MTFFAFSSSSTSDSLISVRSTVYMTDPLNVISWLFENTGRLSSPLSVSLTTSEISASKTSIFFFCSVFVRIASAKSAVVMCFSSGSGASTVSAGTSLTFLSIPKNTGKMKTAATMRSSVIIVARRIPYLLPSCAPRAAAFSIRLRSSSS